jgi:hypothetical protein
MVEEKVAKEVAEADFERFLEAMDLDPDRGRMDADDVKSFEDVKAKFVRAVQRGQLVVDEKGQPVVTTSDGKTLTFYEPTGASFTAMDSRKKGQDVAKMIAMMGDMCRVGPAVFAGLKNRDFKICQAIVQLFLG